MFNIATWVDKGHATLEVFCTECLEQVKCWTTVGPNLIVPFEEIETAMLHHNRDVIH